MRSMRGEDAGDYFRVVRMRLSTFLFCLSNWMLPQDGPVLVVPGVGVDTFKLGDEPGPAFEHFRNVSFEKSEYKGIQSGYGPNYKWWYVDFSNDTLGIRFRFEGKRRHAWSPLLLLSNRTELAVIQLSGDAITTGGIRTRASNWDDVINVHGPIAAGSTYDRYIEYAEQGVSFYFDESRTVIGIHVFEPTLP